MIINTAKLYLVGALFAALAAFAVTQTIRLAGSEAALARAGTQLLAEQKAASDLRADRAIVAEARVTEVAKLKLDHANKQQEIVNEYRSKLAKAADVHRADTADGDRLREQVLYFAAASGSQGNPDSEAACRSDRDKALALGRMVAEGVGLVIEGRGVVQQQVMDIDFLLKIHENTQTLERQR